MSPEAWAFLSSSVVTVGSLGGMFVQSRRQHEENQRTGAELRRKVEPVSNGFAGHVLETLARIEVRLDEHVAGHSAPQHRRSG